MYDYWDNGFYRENLCYVFQITTVIRGEFIGDGLTSARGTCINYITIIPPSFILPVSSITCSGNPGQATFTVESIGSSEAGNNCNDNMVLVSNQCGKLIHNVYNILIADNLKKHGHYFSSNFSIPPPFYG